MPIEMPPGDRKYTTEFTLVLAVAGAYLLRAQDLQNIPIEAIDEDVHQQYLAKNPFGYRCHANTGVKFPETA